MFIRYLQVVFLLAAAFTGRASIQCPPNSEYLDGICQCVTGTFMVNNECSRASQVLPGDLRVTSLVFVEAMSDRSSEIFRETAQNISDALRAALSGTPGYVRSDVVKLEQGSVVATVNNIFENITMGNEEIQDVIDKAIRDAANSSELLKDVEYKSTNLCEITPSPCQMETTNCVSERGLAFCFCKDGYIHNPYSNRSCLACPSGQRARDGVCEPCPFGREGINCNSWFKLAFTVVSCILGGILLIMAVAGVIYYCRHTMSTQMQRRPSEVENRPTSPNCLKARRTPSSYQRKRRKN